MATGIAKLQLLIDLKNNLKAGLDGAKKHVEKATGDMQKRLDTFKTKNIEVFNAIKNEVPGVGRAVGLLANPYALVTVAVLGVGAALGGGVKAANAWHEKMAEINVTAELAQAELRGLSDELLNIGARNVAPLEDVPMAFGRIISAGLDVETSLATLEPTLRAAKAGFADIEVVAGAATSIMMASGEDATRVFDILFETVKEGNAEFRDIAQYLPKVIPLAKNVGFALDETAGAYASLTTKLSTEQSTTALQGFMRALSSQRVAIGEIDKATGKYVSGFKSIGVDVFDPATNKIRPVVDIIKDIDKQMAGLSDKERMLKFDKLGLDQMGTLGFSTLMQDVEGLEKAINATVNSAGALEKAYADSLTPLEYWKEVLNSIKAASIKIGEVFLPVIGAIGSAVLGVVNFIKGNGEIVRGVLIGLGVAWSVLNAKVMAQTVALGVLKVATLVVTAAQWLYNTAMNANPIGLLITLIGGLIGYFMSASTGMDKFRAVMLGTWEIVKGFGNILKEYVVDRIKGVISGLGAMGSAISKLFSGDFEGAWEDAKQGVKDISGVTAVENAFSSAKGLKESFNNKYNEFIIKSEKEKEDASTSTGVPEPDNPVNPTTPTFTTTPTGDDAKAIRGGSQTKNITINIDSFIKGFNPTHQSINGMNKDELERWMTEMFMRVVRHAETSL